MKIWVVLVLLAAAILSFAGHMLMMPQEGVMAAPAAVTAQTAAEAAGSCLKACLAEAYSAAAPFRLGGVTAVALVYAGFLIWLLRAPAVQSALRLNALAPPPPPRHKLCCLYRI